MGFVYGKCGERLYVCLCACVSVRLYVFMCMCLSLCVRVCGCDSVRVCVRHSVWCVYACVFGKILAARIQFHVCVCVLQRETLSPREYSRTQK